MCVHHNTGDEHGAHSSRSAETHLEAASTEQRSKETRQKVVQTKTFRHEGVTQWDTWKLQMPVHSLNIYISHLSL